jgi:putative endopeptidase
MALENVDTFGVDSAPERMPLACIAVQTGKAVKMQRRLLGITAAIASIGPLALAQVAPVDKTIGVNLAYRNETVKPGDDFEEYANGAWRKKTEIPPDRASTGVGFEVFERAEKRNADLIRNAAAGNPKSGTPEKLIADYYAAFMDTTNIGKHGLDPIRSELAEIEKIASKEDLARVLGRTLRADVDPLNATNMWTENLLGVFVTQAFGDPNQTVPYLLQGGLGMPDRE